MDTSPSTPIVTDEEETETASVPYFTNGNGHPPHAPPKVVDLRSDTVTKPTPAMRVAMANAEVDDDVLGADPTVAKLQTHVAAMFGKEAALFVPTGTMGNLICVLAHCEIRGSEVILGADSHIHFYEQGGISTLGGVHPRTVPNKSDGTMDLRKVESMIRTVDDHYPTTRLICLENTQNRCGGRAISVEYTDKLGGLAKWYNLKLHIDGARIMNAAVALGVTPERLVRSADSVSVCLSKGMAAPVGSVIVGSTEFIVKCKRLRKVLGGGMRQSGVLAAAGLLSVTCMADRLEEDHRHAAQLAEGLNAIDGLHVDVAGVDTNIVYVDVSTECPLGAEELVSSLGEVDILAMTTSPTRLRLVTHYEVTEDDVRHTLARFQEIVLRSTAAEEEAETLALRQQRGC